MIKFKILIKKDNSYVYPRDNLSFTQKDGELFVEVNTITRIKVVSPNAEGIDTEGSVPLFGGTTYKIPKEAKIIYYKEEIVK